MLLKVRTFSNTQFSYSRPLFSSAKFAHSKNLLKLKHSQYNCASNEFFSTATISNYSFYFGGKFHLFCPCAFATKWYFHTHKCLISALCAMCGLAYFRLCVCLQWNWGKKNFGKIEGSKRKFIIFGMKQQMVVMYLKVCYKFKKKTIA